MEKHSNNVNDVVLVFSLLTLNIFHTFFQCFYCYFEQVNISWELILQDLSRRIILVAMKWLVKFLNLTQGYLFYFMGKSPFPVEVLFDKKKKKDCGNFYMEYFEKTLSTNRLSQLPGGICLLKVNNGNNRTMCEICSKLIIKKQ